MSKNVVIAGAGALGKHVLDALLESGLFNVTVFSRSAKPALEIKGVTVKVVNYDDPVSLTSTLASTGADTVLSFIVDFIDPAAQALAHRNLLSAAASLSPTFGGTLRRFVPAEYANDLARFPVPASAEADKLHFRQYMREICRRSGIEYTLVCNGILMDFFLPRGRKRYFPDLNGGPLVPIDAEAGTALILGDAKRDNISFTLADDLDRAMVRLLKVPLGGWTEYTYFSGDRLTWEEAADAVERATGKPVTKTHVSLEELKKRVQEARESIEGKTKQGGGGKGDFGPENLALMAAELNEAFGNGSVVLPENTACSNGLKSVGFRELMEIYYRGNK